MPNIISIIIGRLIKSVGEALNRFPRLKRCLIDTYFFFREESPITYLEITQDLIRECIGKPDPTILEIGCNDGQHTLRFIEMFEKPRIYCFEPEPRAVERFRKNVGKLPNVNLFEIALSDCNGEITFYQSDGHHNEKELEAIPKGWDLSGSIKKPKEHLEVDPCVKFNRTIKVKSETLDAWCDKHEINTIDFIWMDVQGAEGEVLRGGKNILSNTRFIYTEYSNRELYEGQMNLKELLKLSKDFKVLVRYPGDVLLQNMRFSGSRLLPPLNKTSKKLEK